jgi:hypothetical protein
MVMGHENTGEVVEVDRVHIPSFREWADRLPEYQDRAIRLNAHGRSGFKVINPRDSSFRNQGRFPGIAWMTASQVILLV